MRNKLYGAIFLLCKQESVFHIGKVCARQYNLNKKFINPCVKAGLQYNNLISFLSCKLKIYQLPENSNEKLV